MGPRVISSLEVRCWASCPSQGDSNSRQSHHGLTRLVQIDLDSPLSSSSRTRPKPRIDAAERQGYYEDMGFFSSRSKQDDSTSTYVTATTTTTASNSAGDKSMVQVIRSRLYGKKGKEREEQLPISSPPSSKHGFASIGKASRSTTSILLPPPSISSASPYDSIGASPRPSTSRPPIPASILQKTYEERPLPATPQKKSRSSEVPGSASSVRSKNVHTTPSTPRKGESSTMLHSTPHRKNSDSVTVTLAQRLNELAVANAEGLLNDDEYRLLRQSLFDRFAGTAVVPQEEAIVPAVRPRPQKSSPNSPATSRPLSNFQVERPTSVHSRNSMSFGVSELFRKATGRRSSTVKDSDTSSIWSGKSSSSKVFRLPRTLSKKSSNSSINTTASRVPADAMSISSKRGAGGGSSDRGHSDHGYAHSSSGSIRRKNPPSSFPTRVIGQDARYSTTVRDVFDEDNLKTAQDIQKEISAVQAEQRRLIDAFNGLELTTISKARRRHHARPSLKGSESVAESQWGGSDTKSHKRLNPSESDALSIRSGTSTRTAPSVAPSIARSAYSNRNKTLRAKNSHSLNPSVLALTSNSSLHRKDSTSSFASDGRRFERGFGAPPPVPSIPLAISHSHLRAANSSSISLARSGHLPMDVLHEDEDRTAVDTTRVEDEPEQEIDDIRRRRDEVNTRYEARLEYLRAKLKGAQLHEKLLKK